MDSGFLVGKRVLLAMSGGVDSTASALLLRRLGCEVIGVTMRLSGDGCPPEYACGSEEDIEDARRSAALMGIEHHVVDLGGEFLEHVCGYFLEEYRLGRTPNPCSVCNRLVKFGALPEKAEAMGIDFSLVATGHYVRSGFDPSTGRRFIERPLDESKDQSYFLAFLSQEQLSKCVFPMGGMLKSEAIRLLEEEGIPSFSKRESQDFRGKALLDALESVPGDVVGVDGTVLGRHRGIVHFTVGQRKGLGISSDRPLYVVSKDASTNRVVLGGREDLERKSVLVSNVNYVSECPSDWDEFNSRSNLFSKIRSTQPPSRCKAFPKEDGNMEIIFDNPVCGVAPGQTLALYSGGRLVLGGVIE